jgi:hypothetical protein
MKRIALSFLALMFAVSASAQTAKKHVNLGMGIDDFAARFDAAPAGTRDALAIHAAVIDAMDGARVRIQLNLDGGRKASYLFDKRALCEIEITAGNPYAHELEVLTAELGASQIANLDMAQWDRKDGTRFTLTSKDGTGVLLITPTPVESK